MFARFLPLAGVALFLAVNLGRVWWQRRRHGTSGVILFRAGSLSQQLHDAGFLAMFVILVTQSVLYVVRPEMLAMISFGTLPVGAVWLAIGMTLVLGGMLLTTAAQLGMGKSWRIGIDSAARPGLVTGGLYRFSRNPIFLGMFLTLAGFAVLMPTWLSAILFVATVAGVRRQVGHEEKYLFHTYGDAYRAYARTVGRFVPGLGRLA